MCPVPTEALSFLCILTKFSKFLNKKQKRFFSGLCADRWDLVREALTHRRYKRGVSHERIFTLKKQAAG